LAVNAPAQRQILAIARQICRSTDEKAGKSGKKSWHVLCLLPFHQALLSKKWTKRLLMDCGQIAGIDLFYLYGESLCQ
jgi:hypothetical protein